VSLSWQRCSPGDARGPSSCHKPLLPGDLALRLLENVPQSMESDAALRLGFAVLDRDGAGVLASVCLNRVGRLGRVSRTSANRLAGLIGAHELGHLLLETGRHADTGIMQAGWAPADLRRRGLVQPGRAAPVGHVVAVSRSSSTMGS